MWRRRDSAVTGRRSGFDHTFTPHPPGGWDFPDASRGVWVPGASQMEDLIAAQVAAAKGLKYLVARDEHGRFRRIGPGGRDWRCGDRSVGERPIHRRVH
jgi:hypothetical protein